MEDILSILYYGEYSAFETYKPTNKNYILSDEKATKFSDKIIKELEKYNVKNAESIVDEWLNIYYQMTNEELINAYKKGFKLAFQLCRELGEI